MALNMLSGKPQKQGHSGGIVGSLASSLLSGGSKPQGGSSGSGGAGGLIGLASGFLGSKPQKPPGGSTAPPSGSSGASGGLSGMASSFFSGHGGQHGPVRITGAFMRYSANESAGTKRLWLLFQW